MRESDLDRIIEIENKTFAPPWTRESFFFELTKNELSEYLVGTVDEDVAGYGGMWLIIDEGHITNIGVEEKYRGLGVGNKILEGLIDISIDRGLKAMTLEVRESNKIAKSLYKKHGFLESGIRPNYYADNKEDAIIMWKNLKIKG